MERLRVRSGCARTLFLSAAVLAPSLLCESLFAPAQAVEIEFTKGTNLANGRWLFQRVWEPQLAKSKTGDGLGPMFNERSCAVCHSQGGLGGGGTNQSNVDLLTVLVPEELFPPAGGFANDPGGEKAFVAKFNAFTSQVVQIHSGLIDGSIVLHSHGTDPRYAQFREGVLNLTPTAALTAPAPEIAADGTLAVPRRPAGDGPITQFQHGDVTLQISGRNSTAMFGAGLIDQITDAELRNVAAEQRRINPKLQGRVSGRFGWRGQTAHLGDFVKAACAVELGLEVPDVAQTENPVPTWYRLLGEQSPQVVAIPRPKSTRFGDSPGFPATVTRTASPRSSATRVVTTSATTTSAATSMGNYDLTEEELGDLTAYVASLPAPERQQPGDRKEGQAVQNGEQMFTKVGCAECHRPSIGHVYGLYSDLLLHDMGKKLDDPQAAPRDLRISAYYGAQRLGERLGVRSREWKTPPLWGVADSAPYMHDGRAKTLDEAILWHDGEAAPSVAKYQALSESARRNLLLFLSMLGSKKPALQPEQAAKQ